LTSPTSTHEPNGQAALVLSETKDNVVLAGPSQPSNHSKTDFALQEKFLHSFKDLHNISSIAILLNKVAMVAIQMTLGLSW
jgi:hypothetical protein